MSILNSKAAMVGVGVAVAGLVVYLLVKKTGDAAANAARAVGTAVNPVSDRNLAYRGVNAVGEAVSGTRDFSLGGWLYDLTHEEYDPNKGLQSEGDVLREGARNTDSLWGKIGGVVLRN